MNVVGGGGSLLVTGALVAPTGGGLVGDSAPPRPRPFLFLPFSCLPPLTGAVGRTVVVVSVFDASGLMASTAGGFSAPCWASLSARWAKLVSAGTAGLRGSPGPRRRPLV